MKISEITEGAQFDGFYLFTAASVKTTTNGSPFLNCKLRDQSGEIDGKIWDYSGDIHTTCVGSIVKVRAKAQAYKDALQLIISNIRPVRVDDNVNLLEIIPTAPIDPIGSELRLRELLSSIDTEYQSICLKILERQMGFFNIPAAKSIHHAFLHGLLMHVGSMMEVADKLASVYPFVDRSLLLAGTFLHDIGKEREYLFSPVGLVTDYSRDGKLIGHPVMGAMQILETAKELGLSEEKTTLLVHMALSHHGEPEWGAAVRPMFVEAELLNYIDLIDAKAEIYRETLERMEPGTFSETVKGLGRQIYKKTE